MTRAHTRGTARALVPLALWLLAALTSRAGPADYALPPPPFAPETLVLPSVAPVDTNTAPEEITDARGLRDAAIRAFQQQQYDRVLDFFERMPTHVETPLNLVRMHAWSATLAGQDAPAGILWARLATNAPTELQPVELAGWHAFRQGQGKEAMTWYTRAARLEPGNIRLKHMSGLSAWLANRPATAQRMLVEALRVYRPQPESVLAMAAMQASLTNYPEALGWLRRALPLLPEEARPAWLTRAEFQAIATHDPEAWQEFRKEFNLPELPAPTEGESDRPGPRLAQQGPPPLPEAMLRLSPFAADPCLRLEQIRAYQMDFALRRLRVTEQMEEESTLGNYETITHTP